MHRVAAAALADERDLPVLFAPRHVAVPRRVPRDVHRRAAAVGRGDVDLRRERAVHPAEHDVLAVRRPVVIEHLLCARPAPSGRCRPASSATACPSRTNAILSPLGLKVAPISSLAVLVSRVVLNLCALVSSGCSGSSVFEQVQVDGAGAVGRRRGSSCRRATTPGCCRRTRVR